jgi:hypothetical protein
MVPQQMVGTIAALSDIAMTETQIRQLLLWAFRKRLKANSARDGRNLPKRRCPEASFAAPVIPHLLNP